MPLPTLYTDEESGNCYKVLLLAALLGIELKHIEIDHANNQQQSPEFLAVNPRGTVPALIDGEKTFIESAAILVYLADSHPDPKTKAVPSSYWSSDASEQAAIVDWLAFAASSIQFGICTARSIISFGETSPSLSIVDNDQTLREAKTRSYKSLDILEAQLKGNEWLALGRPTIADVAVFSYVAVAGMGDISLESHPAVKQWVERIKSLEGFIPIKGMDDPTYRRR